MIQFTFLCKWSINLQDELSAPHQLYNKFYDSLTKALEAGVMDTELLIYFAFASKINLDIFPFLFSYVF